MSQEIQLYDTMRRAKIPFVPIDPSLVRVYSCGPTVYSEPHIGNFRAFTLADLLRVTLEHIGGYKVKQVMNITDVGHLTDEINDQGQDKMEKGAQKEGRTVREVAKTYADHFLHYMKAFNLAPFDVNPRATDHIEEQIEMVKKLTNEGYTYIIEDDGIYMDTSKIADYGKLAKLDIEGLSSQHRGDGAQIESSKKRQLTDFALRKFSPKGEKRGMERVYDGAHAGALLVDTTDQLPWNSADSSIIHRKYLLRSELTEEENTTRGFPGRHIECSAMSIKYLGEQFDIHTGGVDHIPVHHTNEIAQSETYLGKKPWVNYRLHQQFLNTRGEKMAKSKGDDLSVPGLDAKGFNPLDIRYFFLTAHYRSFLDFSREALESARATRANMIKKIAGYSLPTVEQLTQHVPGKIYQELATAMSDDLDTVKVLTLMHTHLGNADNETIKDMLLFDYHITKLDLLQEASKLHALPTQDAPPELIALADQRIQAKKDKDFALADQLRDQIREKGREVKDSSEGYELVKL